MGLPEQVPQARPATDAEARALASGLRLRILRLTRDEALTNKEIAERVGRNPASVLHHVRTLVDAGFLHSQPVRRGARGSREVPYRATGKAWLLAGRGPADDTGTTRLSLRLTDEGLAELRSRIGELLEEFLARPVEKDAAPWSVRVELHPDTERR